MNDKSNPTLEEMASEISEMEKQLLEMKKAYREKKYEGLKIAMDARKSADEAVNEELKSHKENIQNGYIGYEGCLEDARLVINKLKPLYKEVK